MDYFFIKYPVVSFNYWYRWLVALWLGRQSLDGGLSLIYA